MKSSEMKSNGPVGGKQRPVTVISLDHYTGVERLNPGEPTEISPGVTISVLQTAAEGLLEIDSSIESRAEVNGKRALELATVQVGQIIKTSKGRFVLVRHLDSFVVPRDPGYSRPAYILDAISLAQASIVNGEPLIAKNEMAKAPKFFANIAATASMVLSQKPGRKAVVRSLIGIIAIGIATMLVYSRGHYSAMDQQSKLDASKSAKVAKSTIVSTQDSSELDAGLEVKASNVTKSPTDAPATMTGSLESTISVRKQLPSPGKPLASSQVDRTIHREKASPSVASVRSIHLSEKDRQTIVEYKLEARFDRSSARAKLNHMAKSFPAGSPARAEVERAYMGL